jgi:branched-chain amino acid transport system ATP-binding protein
MQRNDAKATGASDAGQMPASASGHAMPISPSDPEPASRRRPASDGTAPANTDVAIEFEDVVAGYKDFMVLDRLSFQARRAAITLLLGPNGAGKSTVLKALFGLLDVRSGHIRVEGRDVTRSTPRDLLAQGVAFVPQGRNLFGQLTVFQNLELARALLLRPRVILIDEPSIGLSPLVVRDVFALLRRLVADGATVLMVEQNVKTALKVSDDAIALESGRLVLHKPADELLADPHIERLFLGGASGVEPAGNPGPASQQ